MAKPRTHRKALFSGFDDPPIHRYPPSLICAKFAKESGIALILSDVVTPDVAIPIIGSIKINGSSRLPDMRNSPAGHQTNAQKGPF